MTDSTATSPLHIVRAGRGTPLTLFAPGGNGDNLPGRMSYADQVKGTKIGFVYEHSGHFAPIARIRRQADRDAAEVRALAEEYEIKQGVGFSRGARAIVGALADDPGLLERVALVLPPRGTTAGKWMPWLESRPKLSAEILVIGDQVDAGHPVEAARFWAKQLGARLEILPRRTTYTDPEHMKKAIGDFLNIQPDR